ncbi:MAG: oligosaccharide flippase family protein [Rhodothermales bacterium]|nr:oligosaccharide flippase family protein [Rhodothermales bacterium]MBO6781088.1 oligosaccharide flippase family protein [Rhodothermales bacterium]
MSPGHESGPGGDAADRGGASDSGAATGRGGTTAGGATTERGGATPPPGSHPTPPRPQGIARNITWLGFGSAAVSPLWFFFISYLCIRNLSADAYGLMNWALWLMIIATSATDLGLNDFVTREVARQRDQAWRYFSNFVLFRGVFGVIIVVTVLLVAQLVGAGEDRLTALGLAGVYALCTFLIGFCRVFFRAFEVLKYESISIVLEKVLVLTVGTAALLATRTATGTLAGMTIGMVLALAGTFGFVAYRIAPFEFKVVKAGFLKEKLLIAAPLGVFAVAVVASQRLGPVILDFFEGQTAVGRFGAAYRIVEAMMLLPALATAAFLPRMSSAWGRGNRKEYHNLVLKAAGGLTAATAFIGLLVGVGGHALMDWVADGDITYDGAGTILRWLGLAYPLMGLNSVLSVSLIAADAQSFLARFMSTATLASALLFVAFIWQFGVWGLIGVLIALWAFTSVALWARIRVLVRQ